MSYFDYQVSKEIAIQAYSFYALLMAAMRQADTANAAKLREAFPEVWAELDARYHAPGGYLPSERRAKPIPIYIKVDPIGG